MITNVYLTSPIIEKLTLHIQYNMGLFQKPKIKITTRVVQQKSVHTYKNENN